MSGTPLDPQFRPGALRETHTPLIFQARQYRHGACACCGEPYTDTSHNSTYCPKRECQRERVEHVREIQRNWERKQRAKRRAG